jgi:hypothetical protein
VSNGLKHDLWVVSQLIVGMLQGEAVLSHGLQHDLWVTPKSSAGMLQGKSIFAHRIQNEKSRFRPMTWTQRSTRHWIVVHCFTYVLFFPTTA